MDLLAHLAAQGGIARTRALRDAGFSRHEIDGAVARGALRRPRRGWVYIPGCADQMLVRAAVSGVVLTCVTQAERLGLWTRAADDLVHVGALAPASVVVKKAHVHWAQPLIPRHPGQLEDPIENVLALIADCQPHEESLAAWDSAFQQGLVDRDSFGRYRLSPAARRLLAEVSPFRDSGLETFVFTRLRWLRMPIRSQVWLYGHRVDFLIGERLVVQVDGAHHVGAQRSSDNAHDAILRLHGYHVIRVTSQQIYEHWEEVQDLILRAIAQGLHKAA
jgi:very-short-patch-repair endonuclease